VDGLPGVAERGIRAPLQEQELQPGIEAPDDVGVDGIGDQGRHRETPDGVVGG